MAAFIVFTRKTLAVVAAQNVGLRHPRVRIVHVRVTNGKAHLIALAVLLEAVRLAAVAALLVPPGSRLGAARLDKSALAPLRDAR